MCWRDSIDDVPPEDFDALDRAAGVAGCHGRVRQRQADGRWLASYLCCFDSGRLAAAVPVYACRGRSWPDPAYDPAGWDLPPDARSEHSAGDCLVIGGFGDLRSALHVDDSARQRPRLRQILAAITAFAAARQRYLIFPYFDAAAAMALTAASGGGIKWAPLAREARYADVHEPDWERCMPSRVRGVLRRDRRLMQACNLTTSVTDWHAVEENASELIASHNVRKGQRDHPEFVRMRHAEWSQCAGVELLVFAVSSPAIRGFLTALAWKDELELYEVGLTGEDGRERLAAYLSLLFHQPRDFAASRGLRTIRAGLAAEVPKSSRGALFTDLSGGVLNAGEVRKLAIDQH